MILYIHGFGGSGEGAKATLFRQTCRTRNLPFLAPSLPYAPDLALRTLDELIRFAAAGGESIRLIGSSLGGYYALWLTEKHRTAMEIKTVLLNPSIHPARTLARSLGYAPSFYDRSSFEWTQSHLESLKAAETTLSDDQTPYLLMVQTGDELLDYLEALDKLPHARRIVDEGGDHSFTGIERHFEAIQTFLA